MVTDPNEEVIVIASQVVDMRGQVVGVLVGQINMTDVWRITDGVRVGDSGHIVLLNRRGDVIAHPEKSRLWEKFLPASPAELGENPQSLQFFSDSGVPMVASRVPLAQLGPWNNVGWSVVVVEPEAESLPVILHHHERFDGRGYPSGLAGNEIPLGARIFAAADTYDAITSDRPYRAGNPPSVAVGEIAACSGTQFDPAVLRAFVDVMSEESIASALRELEDESRAKQLTAVGAA